MDTMRKIKIEKYRKSKIETCRKSKIDTHKKKKIEQLRSNIITERSIEKYGTIDHYEQLDKT